MSSYVATDRWGTFTPTGPHGERPSAHLNPFARDIDRLRSRLRRAEALSSRAASMYTTDGMWDTVVRRGTRVAEAVHGAPAGEPAGLTCIRHIFHCVQQLVRIEGTNLEPFQLETIRACICSRAVRLLGEDLGKHVGSICEILGLSAANGFDPEAERRDLSRFRRYCRRFVAVVAPRRNGKSKAGKLFVAANAACEPGARIVLLAHQLNAAMLYKGDVLRHLHQLLDGHLASFKIHTAANEIRIEFRDRAPSHVYFVAGGINVSISRTASLEQYQHPFHHNRGGSTSFPQLQFDPFPARSHAAAARNNPGLPERVATRNPLPLLLVFLDPRFQTPDAGGDRNSQPDTSSAPPPSTVPSGLHAESPSIDHAAGRHEPPEAAESMRGHAHSVVPQLDVFAAVLPPTLEPAFQGQDGLNVPQAVATAPLAVASLADVSRHPALRHRHRSPRAELPRRRT